MLLAVHVFGPTLLLGLKGWEGAAASVLVVGAWAFRSTLLVAVRISVVSWRISGAISLVITVLLRGRRGYIVKVAFEGEGQAQVELPVKREVRVQCTSRVRQREVVVGNG